ncbi:peptide/nickel transport system substrate-binding protein [Mucilaginibacter lappiensis]|uniref:Peptide/nickel transport system substrate-binding protein n=1 Tax=Mucilaginibacter lappiensis TaxID=354630 RepID=A0ABR6PNG8_9SPHI|nr:ABC transporter substrate-binding protein [Mucilaginibacter lappiensis]MBB6111294.1 peptide/nickel transport system substrate-binding protein [Mucilaginibacter lappiensis]SIR74863.1 peptide/nickel transport system substrate-binding protein [Mucilaginibacter lappiensis]
MNKWGLLLFSVLIIQFCACHNTAPDSGKIVFNINLEEGLTSLDPAFCRNHYTIWMDNQVFNGLVQINDSLKVIPCIAKSWDISADGLLYTFHLRNNVYFHDDPHFTGGVGRKALAADFVYSFGRLIDPKVASSGSWIFSDKVESKNSFTAPNDSTFNIRLKHPFAPFLSMLTAQYCSVVPKEVVEFYGKDFRSHPIGTGPFKFKYWKEGEVLVLLKNEKYWEKDDKGNRLPYLDAVKASFIADKQTSFLEFIKKELDFLNDIDGSYRDDILTKSGKVTQKYKGKFVLNTAPYLNTMYLGILVDTNLAIVKKSPLKILKVRQAINYAIDRQKMMKYLRNSMGTPGYEGFIPEGMPGFSKNVKGYTYDPERARQLLAEAGFPDGKNLPEISLATTVGYRSLIEYVQGQLDRIGIKTNVEITQGASLRELVSKNGINFFYGQWIADYPDGENYLSVFYSKNKIPFGPNYTGFNNKKFDALFEQTYHEKNDEARYALYQQMDGLVMEQSPVVVLYYDKLVNLYQNNISGYSLNGQNLLVLKRVKKAP